MVPSKWFTPGPRSRGSVLWVVIHTTEGQGYPDHPATAAQVASYNQSRPDKVSAHFFVDDTEAVQGVKLTDIAYAAPGCNAQGIQIEMCGFARWTPDQWAHHPGLLERTAQVVADMHSQFGIPLRFVDATGLKTGNPGVTEHVEATNAFHGSTHTDPGPAFPMAAMLDRAAQIGGSPSPVQIPTGPPPANPTSTTEDSMLDFDLDAPPDARGRRQTYEAVTNDNGAEWWLYAWNGARLVKPEVTGEINDGTHFEAKRIALPAGARPGGVRVTAKTVMVGGPRGATYAFDRP